MPDTPLDNLLQSIKTRSTTTRWGIGLASHYLKSVEGCLYGDLFSLEEWRKAVKEAAGRLTYCDELMGDTKDVTGSINEGTDLPDGFRMSFDCTLTSKRQDRDGDILEPAGLKVDNQMPLLWQHLPMQPIGKHLELLGQNDDRIRVKFGIVDTPLGRDAATLTKAGCLRMSHGFKPYEFEPIEGKSANEPPAGWHVHKGEIREGSLVSIPSNVDGVVEAYSEGSLTTPLVKSWAKNYYDARPVQVPVNIDLSVKVNGQDLAAKGDAEPDTKATTDDHDNPAGELPGADDTGGPAKATENVEPASAPDLATKLAGMDDHLPGSFEWIRNKLRDSAADYLRAKGHKVSTDSWTELVATFNDEAVVCIHEYGSKDYPCCRMNWEVSDDEPQWTGDVAEVEIQPQVVEKLCAPHADFSPGEQIILCTKQICGATAQMTPAQSRVALDVTIRELGAMADIVRETETDSMWE